MKSALEPIEIDKSIKVKITVEAIAKFLFHSNSEQQASVLSELPKQLLNISATAYAHQCFEIAEELDSSGEDFILNLASLIEEKRDPGSNKRS